MELLKACDKAVTSCSQHSADQATLIEAQNTQLSTITSQNKKLEEDAAKVNSRHIFWFVAGMFTAGLTVYLVKK